jgi:acetyl-CoA carboxylase carboxyltransferase component
LLSYFQGDVQAWETVPQEALREMIPEDRRWAYPVRKIIETIADQGSFLELQRIYGRSIITGFIRLEGKPVALIANDCQQLGGAVDAQASEKAARFLQICDAFKLPLLSLTDTPGFMVGPDSEVRGAVRSMSSLFLAGARMSVPIVAIFLRKGYGLGAMAMTGGSFINPVYAASWPTGEFGGMGLEGAVRLGFKKELDAVADPAEREALFQQLLARMYDLGKASEAAAYLEIDAVIDPADTRAVILRAFP